MRFYKIKAPGAFRFGTSQADAKAKRDTLVAKVGCKKKDVKIEEVEVPTSKDSLALFINELAAKADKE